MNVILCIGESAAERDQEITTQVIHKQLDEVLPALRGFSTKVDELPKRLVIAYEPVWAIGTGKVATPSQVLYLPHALHGNANLHVPLGATSPRRDSQMDWR